MIKALFIGVTAILIQGIAVFLFTWTDWKLGLGYCLIVLSELVTKEAWRAMKASMEASFKEAIKKEDDK